MLVRFPIFILYLIIRSCFMTEENLTVCCNSFINEKRGIFTHVLLEIEMPCNTDISPKQ